MTNKEKVKSILESIFSESKEELQDVAVRSIVRAIQPEAKAGKWIHCNDDYNDWLECSNCEYGSEGEVKYGEGTPYCPMCGCRMTEEKI